MSSTNYDDQAMINNTIYRNFDVPPFVLGVNDTKTVSFLVYERDGVVDDDIIDNSNTEREKSRSWYAELGLRGNVTYKGKPWLKPRIPITVQCEALKESLSSESRGTETVVTVVELDDDEESHLNCKVEGLWKGAAFRFKVLALFFFIFGVCYTFLLYMLCNL